MSREVKVKIKNAYGLDCFDEIFFNKENINAYLIYASNGVGKTSLTKCIKDFQDNSIKEINPLTKERININIKTESEFLIIESLLIEDLSYGMNFLVKNDELVNLENNINIKKKEIFKDIEIQLKIYQKESNLSLLENFLFFYQTNKNKQKVILPNEIKNHVNEIFNEKTFKFFSVKKNKQLFQNYLNKYNELLESSTIISKNFDKESFQKLQTTLEEIKFFEIGKITFLKSNQNFDKNEELTKIFDEDLAKIYNTEELKKIWNEIENKIIKNKGMIPLKNLLIHNNDLITLFNDYEKMLEAYILQMLHEKGDLIKELTEKILEYKRLLLVLEDEIKIWENKFLNFKKMYSVPYNLEIKKIDGSILNQQIPTIKFNFITNQGEKIEIEESKIWDYLSQGEKRTLYLLDVFYKIEEFQRKTNENKIIVFDDIIDSFDYKNKQTLIDYIVKLEKDNFKLIILTHSFDFFRALNIKLKAVKSMIMKKELKTNQKTQKKFMHQQLIGYEDGDIFSFINKNKRIEEDIGYLFVNIVLGRQLAKYTNKNNYNKYFINCLHMKKQTSNIKMQNVYQKICKFFSFKETIIIYTHEFYLDALDNYCEKLILSISMVGLKEDLKNKICLSLAVRLNLEKYIIAELQKHPENKQISKRINQIEENQTINLMQLYKDYYKDKNSTLFNTINIFTAETMHLNAFVFENLFDVDINILISLFKELKGIQNE